MANAAIVSVRMTFFILFYFLNFSVPQLSDVQPGKIVQLLLLFVMTLAVVLFALVMFLMLLVLAMFTRMRADVNNLSAASDPGGARSGVDDGGINAKGRSQNEDRQQHVQ